MVYAEIKALSNRVLSTVIMQDQQRSPAVRHGTLNEYPGVGGDLLKMYSKLWVTPIAVSNRILPYCFALLQAWRKQKHPDYSERDNSFLILERPQITGQHLCGEERGLSLLCG